MQPRRLKQWAWQSLAWVTGVQAPHGDWQVSKEWRSRPFAIWNPTGLNVLKRLPAVSTNSLRAIREVKMNGTKFVRKEIFILWRLQRPGIFIPFSVSML